MTERYLGSIISPSPVEPSEGFADSTASGVWNVHDPLMFGQAGDWPDPTNASPSKFIENLFSCFTYTGTGSSQTITNGIDLSNEGGLVWVKCRNSAENNRLFDTERGATYYLTSNSTAQHYAGFNQAFTSSGFSFNSDDASVNENNNTYVSWTFRKQPKFFDVVTYTGDGSAGRTVSHSLGSVPGMIIIKKTNAAKDWAVYHRGKGKAFYGLLNTTAAFVDDAGDGRWYDTDPTATEFTLGNDSEVNANNDTYVAYLFAHNDSDGGFGSTGDQDIIKCGSYNGDGSTSNSITLGFEPQWILIKNVSATWNWMIFDNIRGITTGGDDNYVLANTSEAEASGDLIEVTADGFKLTANNLNTNNSSSEYIYMAIRRGPMQTPTAATDVLAILRETSATLNDNPKYLQTSGFPVDFVINKTFGSVSSFWTSPRLTNTRLQFESNAAESAATSTHEFDHMTGVAVAGLTGSSDFMGYMFRRAPKFFDVVAYTGTGSNQTIKHNLNVAPEIILIKRRDGARNWSFTTNFSSSSYTLALLNDGYAPGASGSSYDTAMTAQPSSTEFFVGSSADTNYSTFTYVAYLFATLAGISKVGTYSGTGSDVNVDCGFTSGARFVLAKRLDSSGDWYLWDSESNIVSGNDPYFLVNSTATQVTNTDYIDPLSSGFTITSNAQSDLNTSGGSYTFLAIA